MQFNINHICDMAKTNHQKQWAENQKWRWKTLDCKWDGYMWRLDGAKSGNVEKAFVFKAFFDENWLGRIGAE